MAHDDQPIMIKKPSDLPGSPMSAIIGFDQPCCFCGYNIRSLALSGNCPECGASVNEAIRGSRMRYQPLAWIQRLKIGAQLAFWGNAALMVTLFGSAIAVIYGISSSAWLMADWINWAILAAYLLSVVTMAVGMLMLSVSAPIRVSRKQLRARVTRTSALCITIAMPLNVIMTIINWDNNSPSTTETIISVIAGATIFICLPLLYFFGLAQIAMISSLIPWKKGSKRVLVLQIYAPVALILWIIAYAIFMTIIMSQMMQSSQGVISDWIFFATIPLVTLILTLVGLTMTAGLFRGLTRQIQAVAIEAISSKQADHNAAVIDVINDTTEDRFVDGEG